MRGWRPSAMSLACRAKLHTRLFGLPPSAPAVRVAHARDRPGGWPEARQPNTWGTVPRWRTPVGPLPWRCEHDLATHTVNPQLLDGRLHAATRDADRRTQGAGGLRGEPVLRGTGDASNWPVDHEVGFPPAARAPQEWFAGTNTSPNISNVAREHVAPTGLRRRACRDGRHRAFRRMPDVRCPERDARHDRCDRLAQRPHQGLYDAHRHHRGRARELAQRQDRR